MADSVEKALVADNLRLVIEEIGLEDPIPEDGLLSLTLPGVVSSRRESSLHLEHVSICWTSSVTSF